MGTCDAPGCRKSVSTFSFKCKCGGGFCAKHRLPPDHKCTYDFRAADRERLAAENPKVVAPRVQEF
jgi:predicted nucleic acid binding AN1-type Zn finger protein